MDGPVYGNVPPALREDAVSRIILTRPAVEAGEALGFLPGDLLEKITPYLRPLHDALQDMMPADEIAKLRKANLVVHSVLDAVEEAVRPGVSTYELNEIAQRVMEKQGATSAFLGYHGYPAVLCTSVNEAVVIRFFSTGP